MQHTRWFTPGAPSCRATRIIAIMGLGRARRGLPVSKLNASRKSSSSSPWSTGPGSSKKSSSSGGSSSSKKAKGGSQSSKPSSKGSRSVQSSPSKPSQVKGSDGKVPSGTGFGATAADVKPPVQVYKLTPPLIPQLLDELSGWEVCAAPLWSTFTGHCEGEWLGQYAAYTPWAGDPEPVWADESGAQLMYAYSRASEARQTVQVASSSSSLQDAAAGVAADLGLAVPDDGEYEELDMLVRTTLRSASVGSLIGGTSATAAAAAAAERDGTSSAAAAGASMTAAAATDDESEGFAYNRDGCVVFTGGSYSLGPELIATPDVDPDDWSAAVAVAAAGDAGELDQQEQEELYAALPHTTVVIEQCLVSSGDARLRLVATLKVKQPPGEREVDVEIARLLLYKEHWYGTAESTSGSITRKSRLLDRQSDVPANNLSSTGTIDNSSSSSSSKSSRMLQLLPTHRFDVPVVSMARPQPAQLAGSWNVFVVSANPVVEENPDTLQEEQVWVYSSREERQQWHVPGITSSATLGSDPVVSSSGSNEPAAASAESLDDDGSGGSFWLPGGAAVTLRMVQVPDTSSSSSGTMADNGDGLGLGTPASNGAGQRVDNHSKAARGLMVGLHWLIDQGSCEFVERQYDAEGQLVEVRHGSAVLGGWCGGRG